MVFDSPTATVVEPTVTDGPVAVPPDELLDELLEVPPEELLEELPEELPEEPPDELLEEDELSVVLPPSPPLPQPTTARSANAMQSFFMMLPSDLAAGARCR